MACPRCLLLFGVTVSIVLLYSVPAQAEVSPILLHPSAVSVSAGSLLPLSCVTRSSEQATWFRNNQLIANSTQTRLLSEQYTSNDGNLYTIWTLVLCGAGSQDDGVYACGISSGGNVTFTVTVEDRSTASFKLRLVGVNSCGSWNSNDSARSMKVQELISTLQQSALAGFCSVQSQQCSYDITNPSFDCSDGPESDTVTFTATVELQSSEGSITADDAVALIDNWKRTDGRTVTLLFQALDVDSSCTTNTSVSCSAVTGASTGTMTESGDAQTAWIVGGTIIGLVTICVTAVILAVIIGVTINKHNGSSQSKDGAELTTLTPLSKHTILPNPSTQRLDTMDRNTAYESSTFMHLSKTASSGERVLTEGVYDNDVDNPMYDSIEQGEVVSAIKSQ